MVQEFIPDVFQGDKRILLLDGEIIGAILRVPQKGEFRSNIHVGANVLDVDISASDKRIVTTIREQLRADGLWFVGIDVIGTYLTEINVTSPTGIQQASRLSHTNIEKKVIDWVKEKAKILR